MMRSIARLLDDEIPIDNASIEHLRNYFAEWANELEVVGARLGLWRSGNESERNGIG